MTIEELTIAPPPAASRREEAKSERRGRIVAATYELLREVGVEELSMKAVAVRAGVSQSTVYNLFGSKQAVLATVFDLDLVKYEKLVAAAPSADAVERIFDCVDIAADLYEADPGFYRATMWRWIGSAGDTFLNAALREPRIRFWRKRIAEAVAAGLLRPDVDERVVGVLVVQVYSGVLADWISGEISLETFRTECKFGLAVALSAFAARPDGARLRERIEDLHDALSAARRTG